MRSVLRLLLALALLPYAVLGLLFAFVLLLPVFRLL